MDIKLILIILALASIVFLYTKYKKKVGQELIVAFIITFAWVSYHHYDYVGDVDLLIGYINLYSLILWTVGLVILRKVYEKINQKTWLKFLYITIAYWLALGIIEAVGYYVLDIQVVTSFPSFLGLGILHLPLYAQIFYLIAGPVYLHNNRLSREKII